LSSDIYLKHGEKRNNVRPEEKHEFYINLDPLVE
jgi:hypothetical protein